jgi:hypothetical protein
MKTAVDTNVFVDILINNERQKESRRLLLKSREEGSVTICSIVYAELAALLPEDNVLERFLKSCGVSNIESPSLKSLKRAADAWKVYNDRRPNAIICPQCGQKVIVKCSSCNINISPRQHILADFIIGAYAETQADRLLSHDRGFIKKYFPGLIVIP